MKLLALDSSLEACSVALRVDDQYYEEHHLAPRQQAKLFLGLIDTVLSQAKIKIQDLDAIAFGRGPGSFTGLRLTASITQGLAIAQQIPVIPVSTLLALAYQAFLNTGARDISVCLNAHMNDLYFARYHSDNQQLKMIEPEKIISLDNFTDSLSSETLRIGNGWPVVSEHLKKLIPNVIADYLPRARDIAELAAIDYAAGKALSYDAALPIYLNEGHYKKENHG